ncbi:MAG TPA: peptidoglycan -binding protein [Dongiaceae bacterium]
MAAAARGRRAQYNVWPGYVDVLSTLLMVVIFVLMVFVFAQVFLSRALTGSQDALAELRNELAALTNMLSLRESEKANLTEQLAELSSTLDRVTGQRDEKTEQLTVIIGERDSLKKERDALAGELALAQKNAADLDDATKATLAERAKEIEDAYKIIDADKEKIKALLSDVALLESLRDELARKLLANEDALKGAEDARKATEEELKRAELALNLNEEEKKKSADDLIAEKKISESARLQMAILNRQLLALRDQIAALNAALEASEVKAKEQEVQIADLGTRLNAALANKVAELASYRSEFFGRLKEVLGERPDIQVVGDRFVFQSEVLFDVGSDQIGEPGKAQLAQFARTLLEIGGTIPTDIDWILRVDGHTDAQPIYTFKFPSNWELSSARAIAVVKYLESQGVPASRLVAAGFAENRPLDSSGTVDAYRRNRRIELKLDQR